MENVLSNREKRALKVKHIVDKYYVPHCHKYSARNIYRNYIKNQIFISEATFDRYMAIARKTEHFLGEKGNKILTLNH